METWKLWGIIIEPSGNQPQWGDSRDILGSLWPHYPGVKTKWATHGHPKWKSPRHGRYMYTYIYIYQYLVGGLEHVLFFHILGISSSQLTKSIIFQRGGEKPPTSFCFVMEVPPIFIPSSMAYWNNHGDLWGSRFGNLEASWLDSASGMGLINPWIPCPLWKSSSLGLWFQYVSICFNDFSLGQCELNPLGVDPVNHHFLTMAHI